MRAADRGASWLRGDITPTGRIARAMARVVARVVARGAIGALVATGLCHGAIGVGAALIGATSVLATVATAEDTAARPLATADDAVDAISGLEKRLTDEQMGRARELIAAAHEADPANPRWNYGRAVLEARAGRYASARNIMREVVKAEPSSALYHMALGGYTFSSIGSARTLDAMELADEGRTHYDEALRLDPTLIEPHVALAQYYIQAPGIAGGSWKKARQHAQALLDMADGAGEFEGRLLFAQIAGDRGEWKQMREQYALAEQAKGGDAVRAILRCARDLLEKKEDPKAALAEIERARALVPDGSATLSMLAGRAHMALKHWEQASEHFGAMLALLPEATRSRIDYAKCLEKAGRREEALVQYREYLTRHPQGELKGEAEKAAERLGRAGAK